MIVLILMVLLAVGQQVSGENTTLGKDDAVDTKEELHKQIEILTKIMGDEIATEAYSLLRNDTVLSDKELNLKFKDIGFAILVKIYPTLRNIWKIDRNPKLSVKQILEELKKSEVLIKLTKQASGNVNARAPSPIIMKLKLAAAKFVQAMVSYFNPDLKNEKKSSSSQNSKT